MGLRQRLVVELMDFSQSVAVVTGAGSGIGKELALQLSKAGARLAINDANADSLAETVRLVEEQGGTVFSQVFDVGSREQMYAFAERVEEHYGQVDIMINNAGVALGMIYLQDVSSEDFEWIVNVNLWGVVHGTMAFLPLLRKRPAASLVNLSSSFGMLAVPGQAPYCTTKFAVRGFTDSIRLELMDTNVLVTLVCPSQVKTNIIRNGRHLSETAKAEMVQAFDEKLTRVSPEKMAEVILDGILQKREVILYARDSLLVSLASRFMPRFVIKNITRRKLRKMAQENS
jgi:butyryl-CoA dehydrogenase